MEKAKKIIAAGHLCLDVTPIFPGKKASNPNEILIPGNLLRMEGIEIHTGGSAANTGLALKFLGADVQIAAKIGKDEFGSIVAQILESHGIPAEKLLYEEDGLTGYTIVLAIPGIDRMFLHAPGANDTFVAEDLINAELDGADLFHLGYPPLMRMLYLNDGEETEKILKMVQEKNIPVSLDMSMPDTASEAGQADWNKILQRILPYVDIYVPSIEETIFMLDKKKYECIVKRAEGRDFTEVLNIEEDVVPIAEELLSMGPQIVLLKCGSAGAFLAVGNKEKLKKLEKQTGLDCSAWADKRIFEKCFKPEKLRSGTGAGDTCIAAFLMAVLTGENAEMSLKLAAAEGACCVEAYDSLSGLRTIPELKKRIADGWEKV